MSPKRIKNLSIRTSKREVQGNVFLNFLQKIEYKLRLWIFVFFGISYCSDATALLCCRCFDLKRVKTIYLQLLKDLHSTQLKDSQTITHLTKYCCSVRIFVKDNQQRKQIISRTIPNRLTEWINISGQNI